MGNTLELSNRNFKFAAPSDSERQMAAAQRRDRLACFAAGLALFALLVGGIMLRVVMFVPH